MIKNTFFKKTNTIIEFKDINLGLNPITDICYGNVNTFFLFDFNIEEIKKYYTGSNMNSLKHTLKMFNCGGFVENRKKEFLTNTLSNTSKVRASSFKLNLYKLNQYWDCGNGYLYDNNGNGKTFGSNFYNSTTNEEWVGESFKDQLIKENLITQIQFNVGDEDINLDLTEYIKNVISENKENFGFCLCFAEDFLNKTCDDVNFVSFYTNNTDTIFKPFIQSVNTDIISDDRNSMIYGIPSKLYLYSTLNGENVVLDQKPTCSINGNEIDVKELGNGIYYVEIDDYEKYGVLTNYMNEDVWSNIILNNKKIKDKCNYFVVKDDIEDVMFNECEDDEYVIHVDKITNGETFNPNEKIKITINPKVKYKKETFLGIKKMNYSVKYKSGVNDIFIIKDGVMNKKDGSFYFMMDTNSFIPNKYYFDFICYVKNGEIKIFKDKLFVNFS